MDDLEQLRPAALPALDDLALGGLLFGAGLAARRDVRAQLLGRLVELGVPLAGLVERLRGVVDLGDDGRELTLVGDHPLLPLEVLELGLPLQLALADLAQLVLDEPDLLLELVELGLAAAVGLLELLDLWGWVLAVVDRFRDPCVNVLQADQDNEIVTDALHLTSWLHTLKGCARVAAGRYLSAFSYFRQAERALPRRGSQNGGCHSRQVGRCRSAHSRFCARFRFRARGGALGH